MGNGHRSVENCAYVSCYQDSTIYCVPLEKQRLGESQHKSWPIFSGQTPGAVQLSLSLEDNENRNIIAASLEVNWLEEYSPDGNLVRRVELDPPEDYAHIQHAIKRADGKYVLAHGWKEDKFHRVCLVDANKKLINSYGKARGGADGENGQFYTPTHLAVDKNNFVFVADYNNYRIVLLDSNLDFIKVLITPESSLYRPCRIALDETDGDKVRLFVGEDKKETKARILVFYIKRRIQEP